MRQNTLLWKSNKTRSYSSVSKNFSFHECVLSQKEGHPIIRVNLLLNDFSCFDDFVFTIGNPDEVNSIGQLFDIDDCRRTCRIKALI